MKTPARTIAPCRNAALILAGSIAALLTPRSAFATDYTWDGGGGDDFWGTGANWTPDGAPSPGSANNLIFAGTTRLGPIDNYGDGDDFKDITFAAGAGAFIISNTGSNGIDWFGSIINNSSNLQTIGFRLYQSASNTINAATGDITLNSSALLFRNGQALTLTAASGRTIRIDSVLADGGGGAGSAISVGSVGTVDLRGANTFTSGITLSSTGTLALGDKSALGAGTLNVTGAGFLQATTALTGANKVTNNIIEAANLTINGSQNLELGGSFTSSGATGRTLTVSNSGTTTLSGNVYLAPDNTTARGLTLDGAGATVISGNIANNNFGNTVASAFTINNAAAVVTLSGTNTYTGATALTAGTINVNSTTAFGGTASTVALNGVTLNNTSGSAKTLVNNNPITLGANNIFTGTGDLNMGTGTVTETATRTWTINGGTLTFGGGYGSAGFGVTKAGTGTLVLNGVLNTTTGAITANAGTLTLAGVAKSITGTLTVSGGIVDLGADLGINSATLVNGTGGTINAAGGGKILLNIAAGDFGVANGGTLTVNSVIANGTSGAIDFWNTSSGTGIVVLNAANTFDGITNLQSGVITVSTIGNSGVAGNLGKNATFHIGTATSTATLKYTGTGETNDRVINLAGTTGGAIIDQSGTGLLKFTSALTATGAGIKTLTLQGSTAGTGELAGAIVNSTATTAVFKTGTGTWTLSGANTYTGATIVRQGQLTLSGSAKTNTGAQILVVDNNAASTTNARLNISSNVTALQMFIGDRASVGQTGAVYHSAGTVTLTQAASVDNLRIGSVAGGWGYYNLSGTGTLILNEVGVGAHLANTVGVMDMSAGTLTDAGWLAIGHGTGIGSGLLNMSGGSITFGGAASARLALNFATSAGGISILNVGGGAGTPTITGASTALATRGLNLAEANVAGTAGIANLLTNGTLTVSEVSATGGANPTALLNFNGGTLKATATNTGASFLTSANVDRVDVYSLGGTIDNNGTAITIGRPLTAPTGLGVNTIPVTAGGTGFVGAPLLKITGGTGDGATAIANMVDDGTGAGTLKIDSITITSPGVYSVAPTTVTLFGGNPGGTAVTLGTLATTANTSGGMTFNSSTGTGTTTLTGTNTYTGATTVSSGTLQIGDGTTNGSISTSSGVTNNAAVIFNVVGSSTHANGISGTGTLSKIGAGTLSLSAASSYTGATSVSVGTLTLDHSGANLGALGNTAVSITGTGTLLVRGNTNIGNAAGGTLTSASGRVVSLVDVTANTLTLGGGISLTTTTLNMELGTGSADRITAGGAATITGTNTINLSLIAGQVVTPGTYTLLSASGGLGSGFTIGTKPTGFYTFDLTSSTATAEILTIAGNAAIVGAAYWTGLASTTGAPTDPSNNWGYGSALGTPQSNWSTTSNGLTDPLQVPSSNTDVIFTATNAVPSSGTTLNTQLDGAYGINSLTFDVPAATTITSAVVNTNANALTLGAGALTLAATSNASGTISGSGSVILNGSQNWANNSNSQSLTVSGGITAFSGATTLTLNGTGTGGVTLSGVIGNGTATSLGLVFSQAGVTQLNGNNTFTGGVTLNSSTVQLGNAGALNSTTPNTLTFGPSSTGKLQLNGNSVTVGSLNTNATVGTPIIESGSAAAGTDTLTVNTTTTDTYAGVLQNGSTRLLALTKSGAGSLTLSSANTYGGVTNLNGGTLIISAANNIGDASATNTIGFNGGTLESTGNTYDLGTTRIIALTGAGTLQIDAGTVTVSGVVSGAGTLTKTGAGTLTLSATNTNTGLTTITAGTVNLTGVLNNAAAANVGSLLIANAAGNALLNISGGTINTGAAVSGNGSVQIGTAASANGSVVMTSGLLNINSSSNQRDLWLGAATGGYGAFTLSGGNITLNRGYLVAGFASGATGIMNITGGNYTVTNNFGGTIGTLAGGIGVLNITSGSYNSTDATSAGASGIYIGEAGSGIMNISGSGVANLGGAANSVAALNIGRNNGSSGIVNLGAVSGGGSGGSGGGTINTFKVQKTGSTATGTFNFHGGTLKASTGASATFMTGLTNAYVYGEGGIIDNNGQSITIGQALLAPTGSGVTSISGLTGSGYINTPLVTISGGTGSGATAVATIDASGNLTGIVVTNPGTYTSTAGLTVTLSGGGGTSSGTATINTGTNASGGLTFTGAAGTTTLSGANTYTGATDVQNGALQLTGSLSAATTLNLGNGSNSGKFILGSAAAAVNQTVAGLTTAGSGTSNAVVGGFTTNSTLTVNTTAGTNTFAGALGGAGTNENFLALIKTGAGTLEITSVNNTYTGGTTIGTSQGAAVVRASATQALGSGAITFDTGGNASTARLELTGGSSLNNAISLTGRTSSSVAIQNIGGSNTLSGTITLGTGGNNYWVQSDAGLLTLSGATAMTAASGARTVTLQGAGNGLVSGAIQNGGGTIGVIKNDAGTWTLSGASNYTGDTTINGGTLIANLSNNSLNPVTGALGNSQTAHNITVNNGGTLNFALGDTFGGADTVVVPTLVINAGGLVTNTAGFFTTLGPVSLNGGTLTTAGGAVAGYQSYSFSGNVAVGGSAASTISVTGGGNAFNGFHLGTNTTFNVADATGSTASDLNVSAPFVDRNATLTGAGGLTKTGDGTMTFTGANTFTGATTVSGGKLAVDNNGTSTFGKITGSNAANSIVVNTGGTLLLAGAGSTDRVVNTTGLTLAAGTLAVTTGASEGAAATVINGTASGTNTLGLGTLTLSATSTLDFDSLGASTLLAFTGFAPGTFTLNIANWSNPNFDGTMNSGLATDDRFVVQQDLAAANLLSSINFGAGLTTTQLALGGGFYEIGGLAAIPEPGPIFAAAGLLGLVVLCGRCRSRRGAAVQNSARCGGPTGSDAMIARGWCAVADVRTT